MKFISITPENVTDYEKTVQTQHIPSLVKFYSSTCGHCTDMQPAWNALKNNDAINNMNIAVIEVRNDTLDSLKHETTKGVKGFPTIRVVINGTLKKEYDGDRSTDDMVNFIKENLAGQQKGGKRSKRTKRTKRTKRSKRTKRNKRSRRTRK